MAKLPGDKDIEIIISADDQTKAAFQSASAGAQRMDNQVRKMGDAYEYAALGMKRMQSMISGMAFGVVVGAVSAVTEATIKYFKEMTITEETIKKLNDSVMQQADAWKILPEPMDKATESIIRMYNADLKVLQLAERDKDIGILKKIENLTKHRDALEKNVGFMTEFGEVEGDNSLAIAQTTVEIEKAAAAYNRWLALMDMAPTTVDKVTAAMSDNANANADMYLTTNDIVKQAIENHDIYMQKLESMAEIEARSEQMTEYLRGLSEERILFSNEELQAIAIQNQQHEWMVQARARIQGAAYQAMEQQILRLVETGKFSVGELAKIIMQQVKLELIGIAARATVHAVWEFAMGLAATAVQDYASAAMHYAAATVFIETAAMAGAGAVAVNAMSGPGAQRSEPGTAGGYPIETTGSSTALTGGSGKNEGNTTYIYYINAIDTQTFSEYVKKNSGAITGIVAKDIQTRGEVSYAIKGNI